MQFNTQAPSELAIKLAEIKKQQDRLRGGFQQGMSNINTPGGIVGGLIMALLSRNKMKKLEGQRTSIFEQQKAEDEKEKALVAEAMKTNNMSLLLNSKNPKLRQMAIKHKLSSGGSGLGLKGTFGHNFENETKLLKAREQAVKDGNHALVSRIDRTIKQMNTFGSKRAKGGGGVNVNVSLGKQLPKTRIPPGTKAVPVLDKNGKPVRDPVTGKVEFRAEPVVGAKSRPPEQQAKMTSTLIGIREQEKLIKKFNSLSGFDREFFVFNLWAKTPRTEGRKFRSSFEDTIQTKLRLETGAAAPESEKVNIRGRFLPNSADSPATQADKLRRLQVFLKGFISGTDPQAYRQIRLKELASIGLTNPNQANRIIDNEIKIGGVTGDTAPGGQKVKLKGQTNTPSKKVTRLKVGDKAAFDRLNPGDAYEYIDPKTGKLIRNVKPK